MINQIPASEEGTQRGPQSGAIERLRELLARATPGPWEWNAGGRLFHNVPNRYSENVLVVHDPVWRPKEDDAALIVEAVNALPHLLDTLDEQVARLTRLEAEVASLRGALISIGRNVGAFLADDVSSEFLMLVPAEVEAQLGKLETIISDYTSERDGPIDATLTKGPTA